MRSRPYVVVIVDDHELFSEGLALLLNSQWGEQFYVADTTTDVEDVVDVIARCAADIAIVDLSMPPLGGIAAIRQIKARHPDTRVLALSGTGNLDLAEEALRSGADGFLPKTARPEALLGPLCTIAEGMRVVDATLLDALLARSREPNAALREQFSAPELRCGCSWRRAWRPATSRSAWPCPSERRSGWSRRSSADSASPIALRPPRSRVKCDCSTTWPTQTEDSRLVGSPFRKQLAGLPLF